MTEAAERHTRLLLAETSPAGQGARLGVSSGARPVRVRYRLGHCDLQATTPEKILDEEDPKAADVMSAILGDVA